MSELNQTHVGDIHIVLAFDENFWPPAYAVMRSVCLCSFRRSDLVFHLLSEVLSEKATAVLSGIEREYGARVQFHDVTKIADYQYFAENLTHLKTIPNVAFSKLICDLALPDDARRAVYLDCDVLVRAPIEELIGMDLNGKSIGAVRDPGWPLLVNGRDLRHNLDLMDTNQPYFNSGVLLIDVEKWRRQDIAGKVRSFVKSGPLAQDVNRVGRIQGDQFILNMVFAFDWHRLPGSWNVFGVHHVIRSFDPDIVHYVGRFKPFALFSRVPFARVYRHTMTNDVFFGFLRARAWRKIKKFFRLR